MGKGPVIAGVIVLILLVGSVFAITNSSDNKKSTDGNTGVSNQTTTPAKDSTDTNDTSDDSAAVATITYDGTGFSPSLTTVKSGDKVTIKNTSSSASLDFDSDPHPVHTDDMDLNAGNIDAGDSKTITVTKKGNFGFHNHHNQSQRGRITIE